MGKDKECNNEKVLLVNSEAYSKNPSTITKIVKVPFRIEIPEHLAIKVNTGDNLTFRSWLESIFAIRIIKNNDYGDSFAKGFKEIGPDYAISRIYDKANRLVNLTRPNKIQAANDESIIDTLIDCANYCIMTAVEYGKIR